MYERGVCGEGRLELGLGFWESLSLSNTQELLQFHASFVFSSSVLIIYSVSLIFWFLFVVSINWYQSLVLGGCGGQLLKLPWKLG